MKKTRVFGVILALSLLSCSPRLRSNINQPQKALSLEEKVVFLDEKHEVPKDVVAIGNLRFQDSGFSTDCNFNSLLNRARREARKVGANIVKVTEKRHPDLWSSCYRLKIALYKYQGDLEALAQYQLQLD